MMLSRRFVLVAAFSALLFGRVHAQEKLPKVLIIGDSISLGYTEPVKKLLKDKADVRRPPTNCQHTGFGLANIDKWLGTEKWDVIHFNWGIWDTHGISAQGSLTREDPDPAKGIKIRYTPEQYAANMTKLVERMEKTGAKLIFATTTPITSRTGKRFDDIKINNENAIAIMKKHGVAVNDLYNFVLPNAKDWLAGDRVHFNGTGNAQLADRVSSSILDALKK